MKRFFLRKWFFFLFLIAIPYIFFRLGIYSTKLFIQLDDDTKSVFPVAVFFLIGVAISITLFWKSQLLTKRLRKLISVILIVLIAGCCFCLWCYEASVLGLGPDNNVHVPEAQDLNGAYYQSILENINHQPKPRKDLSWKQIYNMYSPAVVFINSKDKSGEPQSGATGFIINEDGVILTNFHVLRNAHAATVTLPDHRKYQAFVLDKNKELDFAVLKIEGSKFPCVVLGDSDTAEIVDEVATIGNPMFLTSSFANGVVSGINLYYEENVWLQTTIPGNHGNSGGPIFNSRGEVIGILTRNIGEASISLAVPINRVLQSMAKKADK